MAPSRWRSCLGFLRTYLIILVVTTNASINGAHLPLVVASSSTAVAATTASASASASRIDRGDNDNCIVASSPDYDDDNDDNDYENDEEEISVSVIIVMPTIGGAQRELDTHIYKRVRNPYTHASAFVAQRAEPRACLAYPVQHPAAAGVGSSLITSISTRHPIGPASSIRLRRSTAVVRINLTRT